MNDFLLGFLEERLCHVFEESDGDRHMFRSSVTILPQARVVAGNTLETGGGKLGGQDRVRRIKTSGDC